MITEINTKMNKLAMDAGIYNEAFELLDVKSKVIGIACFAHMAGETEVKAMCKEMLAHLN